MRGFLLKGGKYKTLTVPGAVYTVATGVSNKDVIVFYWENSSSVFEASMLTGKKYKTINVPGATNSYALDLDNEGDVTYEWTDSAGLIHAALLHGGKYYKYGYPKAYETYGWTQRQEDDRRRVRAYTGRKLPRFQRDFQITLLTAIVLGTRVSPKIQCKLAEHAFQNAVFLNFLRALDAMRLL